MNIQDIIMTDIFDKRHSVPCDIKYIATNGTPHNDRHCRIFPFIGGMENANNVILFHNKNDDTIICGQYGGYNADDDGMFLYLFSIADDGTIKQDRRI